MLFLADFPDESRRHEGMSQRMIAVDDLCGHKSRTYLFVSHRSYWRMETSRISNNAIQYRCNTFMHFRKIKKLLEEADTLYFHSVINVLPLLPFLLFIKKQSWVILDVHGVVPEETRYNGQPLKSSFYQLAERLIFKRVDKVITVSDAMAAHFSSKYPKWGKSYLKYPIIPAHVGAVNGATSEKGRPNDKTHVLYSGNLQSWQNIDLMISLIKNNRSDRVKYTIMTGEPVEMTRRLADEGIRVGEGLDVLTVPPNELQQYYRTAHYGFILRDDMLINRVACPTKMVEYLYYGIIPVVKSSRMGDFDALGYEYVAYKDFTDELPQRKSRVNEELISRYISVPRNFDFEKIVARDR